MSPAARPLADCFWEKVDRWDPDWCWEWTASKNKFGYGKLGNKGRMYAAHRLSFELATGPIPEALTVDHLCCNRACVNPKHMELVSNRVNILRGNGFSALNARKTHCPQGHQYDAVNTRISGEGYRTCRVCDRDTHRARRRAT